MANQNGSTGGAGSDVGNGGGGGGSFGNPGSAGVDGGNIVFSAGGGGGGAGAAGGAGGRNADSGGVAGVSGTLAAPLPATASTTPGTGGAGGNGAVGNGSAGGGGGGGGGNGILSTGGNAAQTLAISTTGGIGGRGGNGTGGGGHGGGGGSGGDGYAATNRVDLTFGASATPTLRGGTGGTGGNSADGQGDAMGGDGGAGAYFSAAGSTFTTSGTVLGGTGGASGTGGGDTRAGTGGLGGGGGGGVVMTGGGAITNSGTITGGNGGNGSVQGGVGGAGIFGRDLTITNTGTIGGGSGGLQTNGTNVGPAGNALTFIGEADNATGSLNRLTLSATTGGVTTTGTINGTIAVGGSLTIDPGTAANVTLANTITNATYVTGYDPNAFGGFPTTTIAGSVVKEGANTLTLAGASTYSGGTTLRAGVLDLNAATVGGPGAITSGAAGTGPITFTTGAQTLRVEAVAFTTTGNAADLRYTLSGFAADGDILNLTNVTAAGATARYDSGTHTLTVSNGAVTDTVHFDQSFMLQAGQRFALTAAATGTNVSLEVIPAAPTGSFPLNGNRVIFDGTTNVTATKGDALILTVDPQNFNGGAEQNGNVVLSTIDGHTATIQNAFLTSDGIPNTYVPNGDFLVGRDGFALTSTKQNSILIGLPGSEEINNVVDPSLAAGSHFISGGVGRFDQTDGADTITIGGKGKWAVYANAGADIVTQDGASTSGFDSASVVNVYGQEGADSITLTNAANVKASIFVSGGTEGDAISVVNSGVTTIFGGLDSADGADSITFNGVNGAGGTSVIFGNGGNDTITVGAAARFGLDSTSTSTVYGGFGDDRITMIGTKATFTAIGGEGADSITVVNPNGSTYITGGNASGDQSLDGADTINFNSSGGTIVVFGNLGDDQIGGREIQDNSTIAIYGGKGNDVLETLNANADGKNSILIAGGEDGDRISASSNGGALTIYGGTGGSDPADGDDRIVLTNIGLRGSNSTGNINIFANGGDDSVIIERLGTDTVNTATVFGGGGADSIVIQPQAANSEALVVYGNENADTFSILRGVGQTITIADFKASEGDQLQLTRLGGTPGTLQVTTGSYQTLQQALDAAANTANATATGQAKAAAVVFAGSTYVVIDNTAGAGFQATDQAIKLTGVTDLVGLVGATTLSA